jgi:hypothetical protein
LYFNEHNTVQAGAYYNFDIFDCDIKIENCTSIPLLIRGYGEQIFTSQSSSDAEAWREKMQ